MNIHHSHHSHRNGYLALALGTLLTLGMAACSSDDLLPATPDGGSDTAADARPLITITADMGSGASTRIGHDDVTLEGIKANWVEGDQFIIFSLNAAGKLVNGGKTIFTLVKGEDGKTSASFEGETPVKGESYVICYPANVRCYVGFSGIPSLALYMFRQKQTGNNSTAHLSRFDPMRGHLVVDGDFSQISFTPKDVEDKDYGRRGTLMTFDLTNIPTDLGTPERIVLQSNGHFEPNVMFSAPSSEPSSIQTLNLENVTAGGQSITAYMMMAPFSIPQGETLTITIVGSLKSYSFTTKPFAEGKTYERGKRYVASVDNWNEAVITYDGTATESVHFEGEGTEDAPYLILTAGDLSRLIIYVDGVSSYEGEYFKLTQNINIAMASDTEWIPIGAANKPFSGHFDGGGHTISGEMKGSAANLGFFGYIEKATITNLHVTANVTTTLTDDDDECMAGAIVGDAVTSTISNCTNAGAVKGTTYVGGVVGASDGCFLINCINTGAVTSTESLTNLAGGIMGFNANSTLVGCGNTGSVHAKFGGGIVGQIEYEDAIAVRGCFNTGLITMPLNSGATIGAIIGSIGTGALSHCQYAIAGSQSIGFAACGNYLDNDYDMVAKCGDISALNTAVSILNEGIAVWNKEAKAKGLRTCYPFKAGKDGSTVPVIDLPSTSSDAIDNITDGGNAVQ